MARVRSWWWLAVLVPVMAACFGEDVYCPLGERPGIILTLVDSVSGQMIDAAEIEVIATDGDYVETVTDRARMGLAWERAGRYRLEATATGYRPWVEEDVRADGDECHVTTVDVTALMQPAESP